MRSYPQRAAGFSLIELLTVIGILAILGGIILTPAVGAVRERAKVAASKAQLQQYVAAIQMFKGEYGYFPFADAQVAGGKKVNELADGFIQTLSGRNAGGALGQAGGNRRSIAFHSFSESEFHVKADGSTDAAALADRFNNQNIFIAIDGDGDGKVTVPDPVGGGTREVRTRVTAYVSANASIDAPAYYLYE